MVQILHKGSYRNICMLFAPVTTSAWKGRMTTYFFSGECEHFIITDCILPHFTHRLFTTQWTKADTEKPFVSKLVCFEPDNRVLLARIVEKNQGAVRVIPVPISTTCCHVSEWKSMSRRCSKRFTRRGIRPTYVRCH